MSKIEPLVITFWDDRAEMYKPSVEASVADWSEDDMYIELESRAVLDKEEARKLGEWLTRWANQ